MQTFHLNEIFLLAGKAVVLLPKPFVAFSYPGNTYPRFLLGIKDPLSRVLGWRLGVRRKSKK